MAHPKAVPLDLGGTTRHLLYDINAFCALRDAGVDAFQLDDTALADPRVVRTLVWAGLLAETPDLTAKDVGAWIFPENLKAVAEAFTRAFQRALGQELADPS